MMSVTTPVATPIRQPRGPSNNAFGSPSPTPGPPAGDTDSLRRSNTVSNPRHGVSASISSSAAGSSAFHGVRRFNSNSGMRFRSGSLSGSSSTEETNGLVRKGSGRAAVQPQEAVIESGEEGSPDLNLGFGKGLTRQSSLPSRKGFNATITASPGGSQPPPRPPRRTMADPSGASMSNPLASAHTASHSLSSLAMLQPPRGTAISQDLNSSLSPFSNVPSVSRTQSLRDQARHHDISTLGRSASMRTAAERARLDQSIGSVLSPPTQPSTPRNPFTPPTPPPVSSTAALPPYTLGSDMPIGADIRRHQSFTHGYRVNGRSRDIRNAGFGMEPAQDLAESSQSLSDRVVPPTSPIGRSVWSPSNGGDDGWERSTQQLQDAFEAMQLGKRMMDVSGQAGMDTRMPLPSQEEPAWVANLVGQPDRRSPAPSRSPHWAERDPRQWGPNQMPYLTPPPQVGYPGQPSLKQPYQQHPYGYMPPPSVSNMYPSPPNTADQMADVMELARSRGLNPSTFDCHPTQARFFVIKSYTEDDVQKSLKHGIWSSTVLGNKRLDVAFRESADKMPIYLFFSVNGSRHFCGVAQMLTPVDESQSSNVWAQDKWKGIFKVKWIFVRDVPTAALRHIRLVNTPEQKPITNSRDTQELHYEAGCEVLEIFLDHQTKAKTSLLQDFAYYEQLAVSRNMRPMMPPPAPIPQNQYQMPQMGVPPVPPIPSRFR
ncbi:YT521-B-like domain-domain-containing protein [Kockovaella imperatae]|uniref:YT521-B-like domain-domain-containing protein n=1 Tax=Kockovaella imperatae TaxID=4999 RepID=A0A1Y1UKC8_9TREE|nr:YT521-B-like domain-domain-containing protein [Kockovaella imperatae]ORX38432.1 YT521-B-like domain-domain-containing protein [Kockovaella imperatae]